MNDSHSTTLGREGNSELPDTTSRCRKWRCTLNNWTEEEYNYLIQHFNADDKLKYWIIGKEFAPKTGTPHLQIYMEFTFQKYFSALQAMPVRWRLFRCTKTTQVNVNYCAKDGDYVSNLDDKWFPKDDFNKLLHAENMLEYKDVVWKDWQQAVIDDIDKKPNNRTINWVYDSEGNSGKSFLCKYLALTHNVVLANGKIADIFNQVMTMLDKEKKVPRIILIDIPRSNLEYVTYSAIEKLKDGCFYSGKYEGGKVIIPSPHIFCFANELPIFSKMSKDRWNVLDINPEILIDTSALDE